MFISNKIKEYFEENKDKSKDEIINGLVAMGYKESTAKAYYGNRNAVKYSTNRRKIAFDFFEANPNVLEDIDNKKYADKLDIPIAAYATYKCMFKVEIQKGNQEKIKFQREKETQETKEPPLYGEKYYKGRLRQKFNIDDSKL